MNRLEELQERKRRAEALMEAGVPLSSSDFKIYFKITEEIEFLSGLAVLLNNAPESMNPQKIEEHIDVMGFFLKRHFYVPQAEKFVQLLEKFYLNFNPANVEDFKHSLRKWAALAIKQYMENNKL